MKPPKIVRQASYSPVQMQLLAEELASCHAGCSVCNQKSLRRVGPGTSILSHRQHPQMNLVLDPGYLVFFLALILPD
jgi:hypothetical protein